MNLPTYEDIAQEAIEAWQIDPRRAQRALKILEEHPTRTMLQLDKSIEHDQPVEWLVRSSGKNGGTWYSVCPDAGACTCPDHAKGHICKHRLAVYLYTTQIERARDAALIMAKRGRSPDTVLKELGF